MKITPITVEQYSLICDELACTETVQLNGWPCSAGHHPDLGEIVVLHFEDQAMLIWSPGKPLRCVVDPLTL